MDRSGYARGTLAPRPGMSAAVPGQRHRPMLTMADMGMMMHGDMNGMNGMKDENHAGMEHEMPHHTPGHGRGGELPTSNLVQRIKHGPDEHGPASITMAQTAYRRLDYPGAGLGNDGWRVLTYSQLRALEEPYDRRPPTRQFDLHLTGNMHKYIWGFDGKKWSQSDMVRLQYGERVRINMINDTMMSHPIHLHGMWMDLYAGAEDYGDNPRKHTVIVQPAELLTVDISVDAPGQWAFHCHLLYHMEAGMFRTVAVVRSLEAAPINVKS
jgi:FtsP/CotA-like multicopper oxidase with cupredoxin domain